MQAQPLICVSYRAAPTEMFARFRVRSFTRARPWSIVTPG
jgi:hypothetical protein